MLKDKIENCIWFLIGALLISSLIYYGIISNKESIIKENKNVQWKN